MLMTMAQNESLFPGLPPCIPVDDSYHHLPDYHPAKRTCWSPSDDIPIAKSIELSALQRDLSTFKECFGRVTEAAGQSEDLASLSTSLMTDLPPFNNSFVTSSSDDMSFSSPPSSSSSPSLDSSTEHESTYYDTIGTGADVQHDADILGLDIFGSPAFNNNDYMNLGRVSSLPTAEHDNAFQGNPVAQQLLRLLEGHVPYLQQNFPLVTKHESRLAHKVTTMLLDVGDQNIQCILSGDLRNVYTALHTLHGYYSRMEEEAKSGPDDVLTLRNQIAQLEGELRAEKDTTRVARQRCSRLQRENEALRVEQKAWETATADPRRHISEVAKLKAAMKRIAAQAKSLEHRVRKMKKAKRRS